MPATLSPQQFFAVLSDTYELVREPDTELGQDYRALLTDATLIESLDGVMTQFMSSLADSLLAEGCPPDLTMKICFGTVGAMLTKVGFEAGRRFERGEAESIAAVNGVFTAEDLAELEELFGSVTTED